MGITLLDILKKILDWIFGVTPIPTHISFLINNTRGTSMNLKVSQKLPIAIVADDEFGNAAGSFDAAPSWSLTDSSLASLEVSADGLSAVVVPSGKLGACQVQVLGVAQGKQLQGVLDLALIAGDAVTIVLSAGTPLDNPVPAPAPAPAPAPTPAA
jgi:hypothetical protein